MSDLLDKMIADLKKANNGEDNELIIALRAKKMELTEDATDKDIAEAIQECLMENFSETLNCHDEDDEDDKYDKYDEDDEDDEKTAEEEYQPMFSDDDQEYLEMSSDTVKEFLDSNHWGYNAYMTNEHLVLYEFTLNIDHAHIWMRIFIEANPNVCRINATLPIAADAVYEYPLCKLLAKENYNKRFGSFKYDERDGEVSYEHSFFAHNGIQAEELAVYFHAVLESAASAYDIIRRYCVGKFKKEEVHQMLKNAESLIKDIS